MTGRSRPANRWVDGSFQPTDERVTPVQQCQIALDDVVQHADLHATSVGLLLFARRGGPTGRRPRCVHDPKDE